MSGARLSDLDVGPTLPATRIRLSVTESAACLAMRNVFEVNLPDYLRMREIQAFIVSLKFSDCLTVNDICMEILFSESVSLKHRTHRAIQNADASIEKVFVKHRFRVCSVSIWTV